MQKGRKAHEEPTRPISRKNQSPKKPQSSQPDPEPSPEPTPLNPNFKKLKIANLNLNDLQELQIKQREHGHHRHGQRQKLERTEEPINSSKNRSEAEDSSRRHNPYYEMYRADLKCYGEFLDACQKINNTGINYKWPYCFYNGQ